MRDPIPLDGRTGDCGAPLPVAATHRGPPTGLRRSRLSTAARVAVMASAALAAVGCQAASESAKKAPPPAKTELVGHETELLRLKLSPDAERRLGVRLVRVGAGSSQASLALQGEVVLAPLAGGLPLSVGGDLAVTAANQARADGDLARARAEYDVAQKAFMRADALVREEAGSMRARDEAEAARGVASAALRAAQAQRALLGPKVVGLDRAQARWVRVQVFSADLPHLQRNGAAAVRALGSSAEPVLAAPTSGPPSANTATGAVDLYYALPSSAPMTIGQRVIVDIPSVARRSGMNAPAAAILRDIYGGEWVYIRTAPGTYERRRIEIASLDGGHALVTRGLSPGSEVVTDGAAELFGVEFGAK